MRTQLPLLERAPVDFSLESTAGGVRSLEAHRGRPVVLFYEARDRTGDNTPLKRALEGGRPDGAIVVAAGDMRAFDLPGARTVARTAARAVASRLGFDILLDWKGVLTRPPFSLDASKSNVLIVDRTGGIAFRHAGVLGRDEIARFFDVLRSV